MKTIELSNRQVAVVVATLSLALIEPTLGVDQKIEIAATLKQVKTEVGDRVTAPPGALRTWPRVALNRARYRFAQWVCDPRNHPRTRLR